MFKKLHLLIIVGMLLSGCVVTTTNPAYKSEKSTSAQRVDTQIKIGLQYLSLGEVERALQVLKQAQDIDDKNSQLNEALAMTFQKTGEHNLANYHFQKALKEDPKYTRARNNYAVFLFQVGQYQSSCEQLSIVVKDVYYDRRSDAYANMGLCYLKLNNRKMAATVFAKALQLQPRNALSLLELAQLKFDIKDYTGAQTHLKMFHTVVPKGVARSLLLGYKIAALFNQSVEAEIYKKALKRLYPTSKEAIMLNGSSF